MDQNTQLLTEIRDLLKSIVDRIKRRDESAAAFSDEFDDLSQRHQQERREFDRDKMSMEIKLPN